MTGKAASFVWGLKQDRVFNRSRLLCKLLFHLDHVIQQTRWHLRCQRQIGMLFGAFSRPLK